MIAYRLYKVESGRDHAAATQRTEAQIEARRAQAVRVAAWIIEDEENGDTVKIANMSDLPIYLVVLNFRANRWLVVNGRQEHWQDYWVEWVTQSLGPGESTTLHTNERPPEFALAFNDNANISWFRDFNAQLIEQLPDVLRHEQILISRAPKPAHPA